MLNQAFTAENFLKIFEHENRKGDDLTSRFFPDIEPLTFAVREQRKSIRQLRSRKQSTDPDNFERELISLKAAWVGAKEVKANALQTKIERISNNVLDSGFKVELLSKMGANGKTLYSIDASPESYFVVKQLQLNINRLYGVKQANRHEAVCRVRDTIASTFPFEVIRTDVSSFYESVDRKSLVEKLDQDQLLSPSSKRVIRQILNRYGQLSGKSNGIPRGVGISAYLAELYLRPIDREITELPGLVLYSRYVDDIIAIFARPSTGATPPNYLSLILGILSKYSLTNNQSKTSIIDFKIPGLKIFEYLGYKFSALSGKCSLSLSLAKFERYRDRMMASFVNYQRSAPTKSRKAHRDLVARIKYLTGNTRLLNSKSGVVTGIYYNNSLVTDLDSFKELDRLLRIQIVALKRKNLRERLKKYKFESGFVNRRFHYFEADQLGEITKIWKHV